MRTPLEADRGQTALWRNVLATLRRGAGVLQPGGGLLRRPPEESFATLTLVSAVATVLVVRLFLEVTGYPQIGNDTLHIAHVLWGGLLMLVAGRLSLAFYGAGIRRLSAALLGIGFGLFVDEIGKFVTQDHDYFFRPAAALIYVSFVLLYLAARGAQRLAPVGDRAALLAGIESLQEAVRGDLQPGEKAAALAALDRVATSGSPHGDVARQLRQILERQESVAQRAPVPLAQRAAAVRRGFLASPRQRKWLLRLLVGATAFGLLNIAGQMLVVTWMSVSAVGGWWVPGPDFTAVVLQGFVGVIAGAFFLRGLWALRRDTGAGLRLIGSGFTLTVLLVDVFAFYFNQFSASVGVLTSLLLLRGVHALRATIPAAAPGGADAAGG